MWSLCVVCNECSKLCNDAWRCANTDLTIDQNECIATSDVFDSYVCLRGLSTSTVSSFFVCMQFLLCSTYLLSAVYSVLFCIDCENALCISVSRRWRNMSAVYFAFTLRTFPCLVQVEEWFLSSINLLVFFFLVLLLLEQSTKSRTRQCLRKLTAFFILSRQLRILRAVHLRLGNSVREGVSNFFVPFSWSDFYWTIYLFKLLDPPPIFVFLYLLFVIDMNCSL